MSLEGWHAPWPGPAAPGCPLVSPEQPVGATRRSALAPAPTWPYPPAQRPPLRWHGISSLNNLGVLAATVAYGWLIAAKLAV